MVIHLDGARFLLVGWDFQVTFRSTNSKSCFNGILVVEEKEVVDKATNEMKTLRLLNGDKDEKWEVCDHAQ